MYQIEFTPHAAQGLLKLRKSEPQAYKKIDKLLTELREHPQIGTGHPEMLKGNKSGCWSRKITEKHRLVYIVNDVEIKVIIVSTYGHYNDK